MKYCRYCDRTLVSEAFHLRLKSPDGLALKCKECVSAFNSARYASDPSMRQRTIARAAKWRVENSDRRREIAKAWDDRNLDAKRASSRARNRQRRLEKPEHERLLGCAAAHRRRLRHTGAGPMVPRELAIVLATAAGRCTYCGSLSKLTIDHYNPIARGGNNAWSNLLPCCKSCNSAKNTRDGTDWLEHRYGAAGLARALTGFKIVKKAMRRLAPAAFWAANCEHQEALYAAGENVHGIDVVLS